MQNKIDRVIPVITKTFSRTKIKQHDRLEAAWSMLLSKSYTWSHIQSSTLVARSTIARMAKIINLLSGPSGKPLEPLRGSHWHDVKSQVWKARS